MGLPIDNIFSPISSILMVKMVNKVIVIRTDWDGPDLTETDWN